jgi:hydroxymethylpyrimidine/phosphomethylpyrimidine kinase
LKKVLTIAGSDSSGGAGIQADIKTITAHGMYAMSAVTALTAQNTTGVYGIMEAAPEFVGQQLDCIFTDIYPDSVKIGMVASSAIIEVIAEKLQEYKAKNIVLDPVMVSTSGYKLIADEAADTLICRLLPLAAVITPNIPEAEVLCGFSIHSEEDMLHAAEKISAGYNGGVLVKGGHLVNDAVDLLYKDGRANWYRAERVATKNTHGTGCTLSSAIACALAAGNTLADSIGSAKKYLTGALKSGLDLGKGNGPLDHVWKMDM